MLAVSVEFLHGTFRGDPDGSANTGRLARGEWPPSPSRLFAALVAADGTRTRCRFTDGTELEWLERLPPPVIGACMEASHQRLQPRYVVLHGRGPSKSTHQEYVGRSGVLTRPGVRVAPRDPRVVYAWNVSAPIARVEALSRRAARIGYLGTSDSPVRVRVTTREPNVTEKAAFRPDEGGDVMICVPAPGDVAVLDRMYDLWFEYGADISRIHFPSLRHEVPYRSPAATSQSSEHGAVVAWLRLDAAVSGRRVTSITELFKAAVLSKHQQIHGEPPPVLHGHGFPDKGFDLARFLALPDVGFPRSRGRIHGLALWLPPKTDSKTRASARDAALAVRNLVGHGIDVSVSPTGNFQRPVAATPNRWRGPSRRWATAIPAIHERRTRITLKEVSRWCHHAGLPPPVQFRSARKPLIAGAVDLAPIEVNRANRPGLPYSHIEIWFEESMQGPIVIGSGRQRGFGLCVPVPA